MSDVVIATSHGCIQKSLVLIEHGVLIAVGVARIGVGGRGASIEDGFELGGDQIEMDGKIPLIDSVHDVDNLAHLDESGVSGSYTIAAASVNGALGESLGGGNGQPVRSQRYGGTCSGQSRSEA